MEVQRMKHAGSAKCWRRAFLPLSIALLLLACHSDQHVADQHLKEAVVGSWEEVHGTQETLQFNADNTLTMKSPSENHSCVYDFPDSQHIRIDCAALGGPRVPQLWKITVTSDRLMIGGGGREVGTYKRRQDSAH
jgi:hypothetical protein